MSFDLLRFSFMRMTDFFLDFFYFVILYLFVSACDDGTRISPGSVSTQNSGTGYLGQNGFQHEDMPLRGVKRHL